MAEKTRLFESKKKQVQKMTPARSQYVVTGPKKAAEKEVHYTERERSL